MIERPTIEFDWSAFGRDVRATIAERAMSMRDVGRSISVGAATVCRAAQDRAVTVETMFSLCNWMDVDAAQYCRKRTDQQSTK